MPSSRPGPTILLVEDERSSAEVVRQMLEAFGYRVLYTTNGQDALILYRHLGADIDLILTDMRMPRMNGAELIRAIREFDDEVGIVVLSGRSRQELPPDLQPSISSWIRKPARAKQLASRIEEALEQPA